MTSPATSAVIPAQLSFLAIYNPSLGTTDDTFHEQLLFYYSRHDRDVRAARKAASAGGIDKDAEQREQREQENERLRQIGLAQGMVDFARTFSDGEAAESVETEKSRVVLKELEAGWWVLASVDLTRLPKASGGPKSEKEQDLKQEAYEYSAREVASPALLIQQMLTAHRTFLLHHGPSLDFLMGRIGKEKLCSFLDRFWGRFCRYWEVLLHGNPAAEVLDGLKLSAGGELGMGVGEEEWGSGERAVLEDLVHRTEGMVDMIVSRFGEPVTEDTKEAEDIESQIPWLGRGRPAEAGDGVVFGGTGALSRGSVRDISNWVQQIYVYGDHAYGVKDHPSRRRRKVRRRAPPSDNNTITQDDIKEQEIVKVTTENGNQAESKDSPQQPSADHKPLDGVAPIPDMPADLRPALHDRVASQDHAPGSPSNVENPLDDRRPAIPPPIVRSAEQSLREATSKAANTTPSPAPESRPDSTLGISNDKWVTYLTFGLNKLARPGTPEKQATRPAASTRQSTKSSTTVRGMPSESQAGQDSLKELDPMPDGHLVESQIAQQLHREQEGYFLIGYKGSLHVDASAPDNTRPLSEDEEAGERMVLRTVHVETHKPVRFDSHGGNTSDDSTTSTFRDGMTTLKQERLRVLVYIRRPFVYAFLFEQRQDSLQITSFYTDLHKHLGPLQKPMSLSTSAVGVAERIADSQEASTTGSPNSKSQKNLPVYDLLYDPIRLTVHSSIPNIPLPGTAAAEGFSLSPITGEASWSRIEGLNVHSQILAMLESTRRTPREIEKSAKTSRGWWVVWMRLPPSTQVSTADLKTAAESHITPQSGKTIDTNHTQPDEYDTDQCRVAVLVRKASDWTPPKQSGTRNFSGMMGWTGTDVTGGNSAGWGPANLAGGMGFDPRRYVEGLLSLSR